MSNNPNTYTAPINPYDLRAQIGQVMPEGLQHYHKARIDSVTNLYDEFANQNIDPQAAKNSAFEAYEEFKAEKYLPHKGSILKAYERDADEVIKDNDQSAAAASYLEAAFFEPKFGPDGSTLRVHKAETILKAGYGQLAQTQKKAGKATVEQAIEDRKYKPETDPQLPRVLNWATQQVMHEVWHGGPQYRNMGRTNGQATTVLGLSGLINELRGALSRPSADSVPHPTGNTSRTFFLGITAANQRRISAQTHVDEVLVRMESLLKTHKLFLNRNKANHIKVWMDVNRDPITDTRGLAQAVVAEVNKLEDSLYTFFEQDELEKFAAIHIEPTLGNAPAPRPAQPQPRPAQPTAPVTPPTPRPFAPPTGPAFPAPGSRSTTRLKLPPLPTFTIEAATKVEPAASNPEPAEEPAPIEYTPNFPEAKPDDGKLLHEEIPEEVQKLIKARFEELKDTLERSKFETIGDALQNAGPRTKIRKLLKEFELNGNGKYKLTEDALEDIRGTARENRIIARIGQPPAKDADRAVHDAYDEEYTRLAKAEYDYAKAKNVPRSTAAPAPKSASASRGKRTPEPTPEIVVSEDILSKMGKAIRNEVNSRKVEGMDDEAFKALKREIRREHINRYLEERGIPPSHEVIRAVETQLHKQGKAEHEARKKHNTQRDAAPQAQSRPRRREASQPQSMPSPSSYEDVQKIFPNG